MTLDTSVDLYSIQFWWVVGAALLLVTPQTWPRLRAASFAALNLGFLGILLKRDLLFVAAGLIVVWIGLKCLRGKLGVAVLVVGGLAALTLFVSHKRPDLAIGFGLGRFETAMSVVGFSYVVLRLIDVALAVRDGRHTPPSPAATVNYLIPFHMLLAGPIQSYDEFAAQPTVPQASSVSDSLQALQRIALGLFKKYALATVIETVFLTGFRAGGAYFLLEVQLNLIWLYLDFSGYSDVAVGIGRLIGVATPENFNRPYVARNLVEVWERWHISLSQFIRRNLFIPIQMGLMRKTDGGSPLATACVAFGVSFLLCGLWHGLNLGWLAWGAYQALGLIACNLYRHLLLKRLGRKGLARYSANPWFRAAAMFVTFEYFAFALVPPMYPLSELPWWTN